MAKTKDTNTGIDNTGNWNTGHRNTGNWNTGNWNTGYCNTDTPTVRMFNKDTGITFEEWDISFPDFFYFEQVKWITSDDMTKKEKEDHPEHQTTGGYLKVIGYQEAWRESWDKASDKDRRKVLALPNWDNEIFKEISGINVEKELSITAKPVEDEIVLNGVRYRKVD